MIWISLFLMFASEKSIFEWENMKNRDCSKVFGSLGFQASLTNVIHKDGMGTVLLENIANYKTKYLEASFKGHVSS